MKIYKILAGIVVVLLLICVLGLVALAQLPEELPQTTTVPDQPALNPAEDIELPQTPDAGQEYIDKIYFVGDSTTYHFFKGGVDRSHLLVPPDERTLWLQSDILDIVVTEDGETITDALKAADAEIVIITLGVNGAADYTEREYKTYYKKLINAISQESPNTVIILQSIFPVTKDYSDNHRITNAIIDKMNGWVRDIAFDCGVKFLDTQTILKDENGAQKEEYGEDDGIHMNAEAYKAILEYIRTHSIYE